VKNILEASVLSVAGGEAHLRTRGGASFVAADDGGYAAGAPVVVGIRPERITLDGALGNALPGTLDDEIYLGDRTDWRVGLGGETVTVAEGAATASGRKRGDAVTLRFPPEAVLRLEEPKGP
jgi:ABC-type Fe3+/spermidine/putrescine transport system ATPase subunit